MMVLRTLVCIAALTNHVQLSLGQISAEDCIQTYKGLVIFGRCFFVGAQELDWNKSWDTCKAENATLAQVHSSFEHRALVENLLKGVVVWVALQREHTPMNCPDLASTAFWYDDVNSSNQQLAMANTWATTRCGDDGMVHDSTTEFYFVIKADGKYFDRPVDDVHNPLCQVATCDRKYTLSSNCITSTPIQSLATDGYQACADVCSRTIWCRSFNYKTPETGSAVVVQEPCELFTWLSTEPCPNCTTTATIAGCLHYDADP